MIPVTVAVRHCKVEDRFRRQLEWRGAFRA